MPGICEGRIVIVTGAARGIGREHALAFAREGARVVVNDLGVARDGTGADHSPAALLVDEIVSGGGQAIANADDIADWEGARRLVHSAIDTFGGLDVLVNNAGFLRDRMVFTTGEDEWDAVIRVHLKGHFATTRHATEWWRSQSKAGIAALTLVEAAEMARYGVTANAIAPAARTRMTEDLFGERMQAPDAGFDPNHPGNISPLVVWLGSADSRDVTGRVFEVEGGMISVADGWQHGPRVDRDERWEPAAVGAAVRDLLAQAPPPAPVYGTQ